MKKIIALLLVLVMILGVMAGCAKTTETPETPTDAENTPAPAETEQTPEADNTEEQPAEATEIETPLKLTWQQSIGIDTVFENPHKDIQSLYPYMVFEPLAYYDAKNDKLIPALATEWSHNDDYTEFTFTIREGVTWQDGEPLTADDVVFSFNDSMLNPNCGGFSFCQYVVGQEEAVNGEADTVSGITAEGNVVTIKLTQPTALFLNPASSVMILPKHLLEGIAWADVNAAEYWTKPIGSGPYMINEVKFPDYFTVTRYDGYWGKPAGIKNAQFVSYAAGGNDAAVAAVISGDIDVATRQIIADKSIADNITSQNADVKSIMVSAFSTRSFAFNNNTRADGNTKEDLKNAKVRQAISLLIDEDTIASFYTGQATPAVTLVHPNVNEYNTDIPVVSKDVETAKKLLDEAGFDYTQTIDLAYYYNDQTTSDIMQLLVQDFAEAGVTLNPYLLTGDLAAAIYTDMNFDILYFAGSSKSWNQSDFYNECCSWSPYSFMGLDDERGALFDELVNEYNATEDAETRKELSWQMQVRNYENNYVIPLYFMNEMICYNAASVEFPEDIYAVTGNTYMRWEDWSMLR